MDQCPCLFSNPSLSVPPHRSRGWPSRGRTQLCPSGSPRPRGATLSFLPYGQPLVAPPARGMDPATAPRPRDDRPVVPPPVANVPASRLLGSRVGGTFPARDGDGPAPCPSYLSLSAAAGPPRLLSWYGPCPHTAAETAPWNGSPARAGMDPRPGWAWSPSGWFPRPRGDGPRIVVAEVDILRTWFPRPRRGMDPDLDDPDQATRIYGSPPARGWTPGGDPESRRRPIRFPAGRAGMDLCGGAAHPRSLKKVPPRDPGAGMDPAWLSGGASPLARRSPPPARGWTPAWLSGVQSLAFRFSPPFGPLPRLTPAAGDGPRTGRGSP